MEALWQLHDAGILHGDPHPRNMLLPVTSPERLFSRPRWADFGMSRLCSDRLSQLYEMQDCKQMLLTQRQVWLSQSHPFCRSRALPSGYQTHRSLGLSSLNQLRRREVRGSLFLAVQPWNWLPEASRLLCTHWGEIR